MNHDSNTTIRIKRSNRGGAHPSITKSARNAEIYQTWQDVRSLRLLSNKYGISTQRVHQIVVREKSKHSEAAAK